jgi:hypothetical protein
MIVNIPQIDLICNRDNIEKVLLPLILYNNTFINNYEE